MKKTTRKKNKASDYQHVSLYNPLKLVGSYIGLFLSLIFVLTFGSYSDLFVFVYAVSGFLIGYAINCLFVWLMMKEGRIYADDLFFLNMKKILLIFVLWIASVVLHNLISAFIIMSEDIFFFFISIIVIPLYFIIMIVYTLMRVFGGRRKKRYNQIK